MYQLTTKMEQVHNASFLKHLQNVGCFTILKVDKTFRY